jgi:hypothetical protein
LFNQSPKLFIATSGTSPTTSGTTLHQPRPDWIDSMALITSARSSENWISLRVLKDSLLVNRRP